MSQENVEIATGILEDLLSGEFELDPEGLLAKGESIFMRSKTLVAMRERKASISPQR